MRASFVKTLIVDALEISRNIFTKFFINYEGWIELNWENFSGLSGGSSYARNQRMDVDILSRQR